ncbi:FKBP-type peptidyl-prolyl cis-trans isomerase [Streptomyces sp. NPDC047097]|uniref:FKBP-type peptidyl-prolyl cis-trans isomerase n=1 Tax=Streptomyces sp. NPDC047097 TaxID=3155260 RepID=UPI0033E644A6
MRRRSLLLAAPAGLLALAGCGDGSSDKADTGDSSPSSPAPQDSAKTVDGPLPAITAGTAFGEKPTVAKGPGKPSADLAVKTVVEGSGPRVAKGDVLQFDYLGQIWDSAKVFDNSYDRGVPLTMAIGVGQLIPGWDQALPGKRVGSRVELAIPPALGYGTQGNAQAGIKGTDTLVFVVDIRDTFSGKSSAKGKAVPQDDAALPKVGTDTDGKAPSIEVPKGAAPKKLVAEYILEGDGEAVKPTDKLLLQYKGVLWDGGKEFDSSYKSGELAQFPLANLIKGWQQGLAGKKVGSRVMLVVPPELGYGDKASGDIPANSTLVFSLDILAKL